MEEFQKCWHHVGMLDLWVTWMNVRHVGIMNEYQPYQLPELMSYMLVSGMNVIHVGIRNECQTYWHQEAQSQILATMIKICHYIHEIFLQIAIYSFLSSMTF